MSKHLKKLSLAIILLIASVPFAFAQIDITAAIRNSAFNQRSTSIAVADAATGQMLASHQADMPLNPASCAKILTSAAAISLLGPKYTLSTGFFADSAPTGGVVNTLYVTGNGDPSLVTEELLVMAQHLREKGLRRITNSIVIDDSYFDSHEYPRKNGNNGRAYTAKTSAVSVNFNSIGVKVSPGRKTGAPGIVELDPPVEGIKIINKLVTRPRFSVSIALKKNKDSNSESVVVTGRIPASAGPQTFWRSVGDPVANAGRVIAYALKQNGIAVSGTIKSGKVPQGAHKISIEPSRPLSEIIADMNKNSNNFMAEQLLKHIGAVKRGAPGSTEKGVEAVEEFLASIGISRGTYEIENGSGLSDYTRISAQQLVKVLVAVYKNRAIRDDFIASLSILGVDGTTKRWGRAANELVGSVYAKTGTLNGVSTLAGFAPMQNGKMAAFAILANDLQKGAARAHEAELAVVRSIAEEKR